jgi:hypothetical protein
MSGKAGSKRAGNGMARARQGANGRMAPAREGAARGAPPAMRASARRPGAPGVAGAPRKSKRARRPPSLGGRLAAAIRTARLRARRAAEEFGARR